MSEKNELMTMEEGTFNYDFKPAVIEIKNYDKLVETAEMVAKHYDNLVLTNSSLSEINETHKELNGFIKGLDESRLNVKRAYNEPLDEFEKKIKFVTNMLNKPLLKVKEARDEILSAEAELRYESLIDYIERQLKDSIVRVEDIEIQKSWTNKGNWTEKYNPRKPLTEEIKREIARVEEEHKNLLAQREVLEKFLESKEMDPEGWLEQLEYRSATDIMDSILKAEEKRKEEEKAKEVAEQEKQKNEVAPEPEMFEPEIDVFDTNNEVDAEYTEILITEHIAVTGTQQQLLELNEFMKAKGIEVNSVLNEDSLVLDDLPF